MQNSGKSFSKYLDEKKISVCLQICDFKELVFVSVSFGSVRFKA